MESESDLKAELRSMEERWDRLTETPPTPRTLMRVIEHSLDSQQKAEVYVNRLFRYMLDPSEPHGMGEEFLRAFLEALPSSCEFQEDIHDLSRIDVDQQVPIYYDDPAEGNESPGYVDLVISAPNEWFLLAELKFYAGENNLQGEGKSQTEAYVCKEYVGDHSKQDFESYGYYVYVHPSDTDGARADEFGNLTWTEFNDRVLEPLLMDNARRYPARTAVQLRELADDIDDLTGMTDPQPDVTEKIELYLEHYDAIHDVTQAFEDRWERFIEEWPNLLRDSLKSSEYNVNDWHIRSHTRDWGSMFKTGWWTRRDNGESIAERDVGNDRRILFVHRLQYHLQDAISDDTLVFYFRNAGANDQAFIDEFDRKFYDRRSEIEEALPDQSEITGEKNNLIEARYPIRIEQHDDFFAAYIDALQRAFVDHALENEPLVSTITEIYEDAIGIDG